MQVITTPPTTQGPAELFTGTVHFDVIARGEEPSRMRVNTVRFAPCARTAWHSHPLGQLLHVTSGIGRVASRSPQEITMRQGDTVRTAPGRVALARRRLRPLHDPPLDVAGRPRRPGAST